MALIGRWDLRVPEGIDGPADVPLWMNRLATDLSDVAKDNQGTLAGRPPSTALAPSNTPGAYYVTTNEEDPTGTTRRRIYRDHGAGYDELATVPITRRMVDLTGYHLTDTYANRPAAAASLNGVRFFATDKMMEWQCIAGAWVLVGVFAPEVTALPSSPIDQQECVYVADATAGAKWHFRYRSASASSYKWERVGGSPLTGFVAATFTTGSANYVDLTGGPSLTIPLEGDYDWEVFADMQYDSVASGSPGTPGPQILMREPAPTFSFFALVVTSLPAAVGRYGIASAVGRSTLIAATYVMRGLVTVSGTGAANVGFFNRTIRATPVRV